MHFFIPCWFHCSLVIWYLKLPNTLHRTSLVAQRVKHLPVMWKTRVRSLGREDPLEKEMATHSSILVWRIPWTEGSGGLQSTGLQRVGHDWVTTHNTLHTSSAILICVYKIQVAKVVGLPGGSVVKNLPANAGDAGSIPGSGRSSGGEHGNPLQYSCLENPMDRGAWQAVQRKRVGHDLTTKTTCWGYVISMWFCSLFNDWLVIWLSECHRYWVNYLLLEQ